ncbi:hypothetical protein D3C73_1261410 [compost metagenome]
MNDAVLDQRLEHESWTVQLLRIHGDVNLVGQSVLEPHLVNIQIEDDRFDFSGQNGPVPFRGQAVTHQLAEPERNIRYFLVIIGLSQHPDRLKGIIEKMRFDLGLKHFISRFFIPQLGPVDIVDQLVHALDHRIVGRGQKSDLILAVRFIVLADELLHIIVVQIAHMSCKEQDAFGNC